MIRATALGLAAIGLAAPAFAAEGGPIRGGEHDGFTRIVLVIEPTTEWSLETGDGQASLHFPGKDLSFVTDEVFDKIPKSRVTAVATSRDAAGTTVTVDLGCECRISTSFVGARYLALDVADRDARPAVAAAEPAPLPEPPSETPEARTAREAVAVASAEQVLIRQIERAANQGLVRMYDPDAPIEPTAEAQIALVEPAQPAPQPEPEPEPTPAAAETEPETGLAILDQHDQIEATTVFDRDSRNARATAGAAAVPVVCLPDERLDVGAWTNGMPLAQQVPGLRRQLIGEFDVPNPEAVRDLSELYIRFGFGAEALATLNGFPQAAVDERPLLADLARIVETGVGTPDGPLAIDAPCPGAHGLWLALGGVAPAFRDAAGFDSTQAAFAALPTDLRALLAPRYVDLLVDAGRPAEARVIYDTAVRPGQPVDAALERAAARLAAAEGRPVEAVKALNALIESGGDASVETLTQLVRVALDARLPMPDRVVTDLSSAMVQYRGAPVEPTLRALMVESLARRAELGAAIATARSAMADLPASSEAFRALAVRMLGEADPATVGDAAYSATALASADLLAPAAADDPARLAVAGRLLDLGLPDPALAALAPALATGAPEARLLAARARISLNHPDAARAALGSLDDPEAAELRARAFALTGAYDRALATLADSQPEAAAAYAWPSGDWQRASAAAADDPARLAMATYMAAAAGQSPTPAPAEDPAALDPEAAFREPLPSLDRPTLSAARRLLSTGPKVDGFVQDLLADVPAAPAAN